MIKEMVLGQLRLQLSQMAAKEVLDGKLNSPASLNAISNRLIPGLRNSPLTGGSIKMLKITDEDLRGVFRGVLEDLNIEIVE